LWITWCKKLSELRRRIKETRWPECETVADSSQGVPLAAFQALARYWATEYDWRKVEAKLNVLPPFLTEIDGLEIHFIHVRSKHENTLAADRCARLARLDHRATEVYRLRMAKKWTQEVCSARAGIGCRTLQMIEA